MTDGPPIRLGYGYLAPPGSAETPDGIIGYDIDAFSDFARSIARQVDYLKLHSTATIPHNEERSPFTGVLGAIENGSIFAYLDQNELTPTRVRAFEWILMEDSSLSHFTVFATSTLALIFAFVAVVNLPFIKLGSSTRMVANFFLLYGIFLLILIHGAVFQGNTAFPPKPPLRNCQYFLEGLRSGSVGLVAVLGNTVKNHNREFLLGDPSRLIINENYNEIVDLLCSPSKKYLAAMTSFDFALLPEPKDRCELAKVDSTVVIDGKLQKYELFSEWNIVFLLEKKIRKSWLKKLKWLYNTHYSWENRLGILHRRNNNGRPWEQAKGDEKTIVKFTPFTFTRMSSVLYAYLILLSFPITVFIVEITLPMTRVKRWLKHLRNQTIARFRNDV